METQNEIVEVPQNLPVPVGFDPKKDITNAQEAARALMEVVKATKPLTMNGKQYLYFEHWQTIGQFFSHSAGIEWTKEIKEAGKFVGYEAKAVIYNTAGVVVGGAEAACMTDEKNWGNKPKFQVRSMAQTRAMAKALRSRFGFVAVLAGVSATPAEEIDGDYGYSPQPTQQTTQPTIHSPQVNSVPPTERQVGMIKRVPSARRRGIGKMM